MTWDTTPSSQSCSSTVQAGLLTLGSSYRLRLPGLNGQWHAAAFVPDHSGGPIPDSHGVPFQALSRAPEQVILRIETVIKPEQVCQGENENIISVLAAPALDLLFIIIIAATGFIPTVLHFIFVAVCRRADCAMKLARWLRIGFRGSFEK